MQLMERPVERARREMPPGPPMPPPRRSGPGWPTVLVLGMVALLAVGAGAVAWIDARGVTDDLADARDDLAETRNAADIASGRASERIDALERQNAKLAAQLQAARAKLQGSDDAPLVAASTSVIASMFDAAASDCASYGVVGRSDAGDHAIVRASWNAGACASSYETVELLLERDGDAWRRVELEAHPPGEPDVDTGAICGQVVSGIDSSLRDAITQACR